MVTSSPLQTRTPGHKLQPGAAATEAELKEHCRAGIANYKVPERIFFVDRFPSVMGPNGEKVQKSKLREMAIELGGLER